MKFRKLWLPLTLSFFSYPVFAASQTATLTTRIELLPACKINDKIVNNGNSLESVGQLNFGRTRSGFSGIIETSLSGAGVSGLTIQCLVNTPIKITFGAGQNDSKVPQSFNGNYYRAVSNGTDYVAYNLLYGPNKNIVKPNESLTLQNNGQTHILNLSGRAINDGRAISQGNYTDIIPVTIEF